VLGQSDFGLGQVNGGAASPSAASLNSPGGIARDPITGKLFVCDTENNRILRFGSVAAFATGAAAEAVLEQSDFVTATGGGAEAKYNRPDGVLGQPDFDTGSQSITADGLVAPTDIAVSPYDDLWVVQSNNVAGGNRVSRFRPDPDSWRGDVLIGAKKSSLRGNNLYNLSGGGQTVSAVSKNLRKLTFFLNLQNAGIYADDLKLLGSKGNRDFKVTYFETTSGKRNVTGAMTSGNLSATGVLRGGVRTYLVEVKPGSSMKGKKKTRSLSITGTSLLGGNADRVKARSTTAK